MFLVLFAVMQLAGTRIASAQNGQDRVSFGSRVVVNEDETVGDVVCFFCSVEVHGKIQGDVVTFLGDVKSTSPIQGDLVSFAGNVALEEDAAVHGDLVIFGGGLHKSAGAYVGQDQVVFPTAIFLAPILVIAGVVWAISALFRRRIPLYYVPPAR